MPGQDDLVLRPQETALVERRIDSLRREFKWFRTEIESALLKRHKTCRSEKARPEIKLFILKLLQLEHDVIQIKIC